MYYAIIRYNRMTLLKGLSLSREFSEAVPVELLWHLTVQWLDRIHYCILELAVFGAIVLCVLNQ